MRTLITAVDEIAALEPDHLPDVLLGAELSELGRQIERLQAQRLRLLEAFDRRGAAMADGHVSTAAWLRRHGHLSPGTARGHVRLARQLADDLPETAAAFRAGDINLAHTQVIGQAARDVPDEHLAVVDAALAAAAKTCDARRLAWRLKDLRHQLMPEAVVKEEHDAYEGRYLDAASTIGGMVAVSALLDPETGGQFLTLLSALTERPGPDEPLTAGQRRADAFAQVIRLAQSADRVPNLRGESPTVMVQVDLETLEGRPGAPSAILGWTGPVSGEAARRIACDAGIARVITKGKSVILDLGRKTRVVTPDQFRALVVRDGGCRFNECGRPPDWCRAHHIEYWACGGPTDLCNMVLLCEYHHHAVHEGGWTIELLPDGAVRCFRRRRAAA